MKKGFTLIELLVTIAIIAILTGVISVFIYNAKNQGNDAGIKRNLIQVRNQAEILAGSGPWSGVYGITQCSSTNPLVCAIDFGDGTAVVRCADRATSPGLKLSIFDDLKIVNYLQTIIGLSGPNVTCAARRDSWSMAASLKTIPTNSWCVDSTGAGRVGSISLATGLCS